MRAWKATLQEIKLQFRSGIYALYAVLTLTYLMLLWALPAAVRGTAAVLLIFSDPAAMGLFFMGALVLLEKSQRVHCSLAASPLGVWEYLFAKVVSLGLIGTLVALLLAGCSGSKALACVGAGTLLSSALFSLCGLLAATRTNSLNRFLLATIPFEMVLCIPAVLWLFGVLRHPLWLLHPGVCAMVLLSGGSPALPLFCLSLWTALAALFCARAVRHSFSQLEGGRL